MTRQFVKKRGLIIGNCQVQIIRQALSIYLKNVEIEGFGVHLATSEETARNAERFLTDRKSDFDFIIAIPLSADFGPFKREDIEKSFAPVPVCIISNVVFTGLHPDLTYIGGLAQRLAGPLGDYHSKIAVLAFVCGLSIEAASHSYCDDVYDKLGYYDAFDESLREMRKRDLISTVPIGDWLETAVRSDFSFFSNNHPASHIMVPYVLKIAQWISDHDIADLSGWSFGPGSMPNFLAESAIYPVFPEICNRHSLPYKGSYLFKPDGSSNTAPSVLNLKEFLVEEYAAFSAVGLDKMRESIPTCHWLHHHRELLDTWCRRRESCV